MKFLPRLTGLAFLFASLNLFAISPLAAQSDSEPPPAAPLSASSATIDFGADLAQPKKHDTTFARVALNARQVVTITLQYDPSLSGQSIVAEPLDGGQINAAEQGLVVDQEGVLRFQFQAGESPGLSRIALHQEGEGDTLQFWVIDTRQPADNPTAFPEN